MATVDSVREAGVRRVQAVVDLWPAINGEVPPDLLDRRDRALAAIAEAMSAEAVEEAILSEGLGVL